jgi:RNA polymerase sigma-B factor
MTIGSLARLITKPRRRTAGPGRVKSLSSRRQVDGDGAARDALVRQFLPLARELARRYTSSSNPDEELVGVAGVALTKAIDRFDADSASSFPSFAIPTILDELRRHVASSDWAERVSRTAHERVLAVTDATEELTERRGRAPTVQDLAAHLELSTEEVLHALDVGRPYTKESRIDDGVAARVPLHSLPEREQEILRMRFVESMSQSQIAARLGVSQVQVSRSLRCSLELLRQGGERRVGHRDRLAARWT